MKLFLKLCWLHISPAVLQCRNDPARSYSHCKWKTHSRLILIPKHQVEYIPQDASYTSSTTHHCLVGWGAAFLWTSFLSLAPRRVRWHCAESPASSWKLSGSQALTLLWLTPDSNGGKFLSVFHRAVWANIWKSVWAMEQMWANHGMRTGISWACALHHPVVHSYRWRSLSMA